ncbi:MAG TPA: hypothetical protein VIQ79_03335, partial [Kribbella sp.]
VVHVARPSWAEAGPVPAAARRTAPPRARPPSGRTDPRESEPTQPTQPTQPTEPGDVGLRAVEGVVVETVADRSRWRADEGVLQRAAAFAATG